MSQEKIFKTLGAFDRLPESEEKEKIRRPYLNDEETIFEFLIKAEKFLDEQNKPSNISPYEKLI